MRLFLHPYFLWYCFLVANTILRVNHSYWFSRAGNTQRYPYSNRRRKGKRRFRWSIEIVKLCNLFSKISTGMSGYIVSFWRPCTYLRPHLVHCMILCNTISLWVKAQYIIYLMINTFDIGREECCLFVSTNNCRDKIGKCQIMAQLI